jgi:hypothetical protein
MNQLRVVGPSADLDSLVLAARKAKGRKGTHVLPIDEKLFRVLEDVVRGRRAKVKGAQPVKQPPSDPKLAPREVQRLLRAGRPVDQVAKAAGMDVAWVERFLGPVLDERDVAIQDFRGARLEKPRLGVSGVPLGEAVLRNLKARRVRLTEAEVASAWGAYRTDSQPWVITLTFSYRGREQRAMWRYDPRSGEVTAANRLGSDLGWVANARARTAQGTTSARTSRSPRGRSTSSARTSARRKTARKATTRKASRKTPARKPAARRTAPRRAPTRRAASKRAPARRPARGRAGTRRRATR